MSAISRSLFRITRLLLNSEASRASDTVWNDYAPSIVGVKEFPYELSGDAYNVPFEHFSFALGTREFVMHNPRDEQVMTSHDMDLLQRMPSELGMRRGYYAVHDTPHPHWKYFLFD